MRKKSTILSLLLSLMLVGCYRGTITNPNSISTSDSIDSSLDESSSSSVDKSLSIEGDDSLNILVGEKKKLTAEVRGVSGTIKWESNSPDIVEVNEEGVITGVSEGIAIIIAYVGDYKNDRKNYVSDYVTITVKKGESGVFEIDVTDSVLSIGEEANISSSENDVTFEVVSGDEFGKIDGNVALGLNPGTFEIQGRSKDKLSNVLTLTVSDSDPYLNVSSSEFYKNYKSAVSYSDAKYRSKHYLMSGELTEQDQKPYISSNRPTENGKLVRNTSSYYIQNNMGYQIVDSSLNVTGAVFKGGAYTTLREVVAYVFAFGDAPENTVSSKDLSPSSSGWGKYLRLNNSYYSSDTNKYKYEPTLPEAYGPSNKNGTIKYYEMDIGTTGTDSDPKYPPVLYNDGKKIERGAARIVFSKTYVNNSPITDSNERYVFYTYNHYNDFQEYLNYDGGWGMMFGNITGGGKISSNTDYNPTPYVETVRKNL